MVRTPNHELLKQIVGKNHVAQQLTLAGRELVKKSRLPNVITAAQFKPYIELYRVDIKRRDSDKQYRDYIQRLYNSFITELEINRYQPIVVIESLENPVDVYYLERQWTPIQSDLVRENESARSSIPNNIPKTAQVTRDELIEGAILRDIVAANSTPEQRAYFNHIQKTSAFLKKRFTERNLRPDLKPAEETSQTETLQPTSQPSTTQYLDDDDD